VRTKPRLRTELDWLPSFRSVFVMALGLLWAGCARSVVGPPATADRLLGPTATASPQASLTDTPPSYEECGWTWSTRPLPELTDQLQAALDAAGIPGATARAYAFGENCLDQSGTVKRFARMENDFDIQLEVADLQDLDALGDLTEQVLAVLEALPPESDPPPQPGRIGLKFSTRDTDGVWLYFMEEELEAARGRGLTGRALLEALGYPP